MAILLLCNYHLLIYFETGGKEEHLHTIIKLHMLMFRKVHFLNLFWYKLKKLNEKYSLYTNFRIYI